MSPLSDHPPANGFNDSEVAREAARLEVALINSEQPIAPTVEAISTGISVGMSYREMAHLAGMTENALRKRMATAERNPSDSQVELIVRICAAHAGEAIHMDELAARTGLHREKAEQGAEANQRAGYCRIAKVDDDEVYVTALPAAVKELRAFINWHFMSEPDRFMVVLRLGELKHSEVQRVLNKIDPTDDLAVLYPSDVLATAAEGNGELLLRIAAASSSAAMAIAAGPWHSILDEMGLPHSDPPVIDIIPPGNRRYVESEVLTTFFDQLVPSDRMPASTIEAYRASYLGESNEADLTARCLTAAARAIRRAAGNMREPQLVSSGGTAFMEGSIAHQLRLTAPLEKIQEPAVKALLRGAARLGPIPAGELGHISKPGEGPFIVESVSPTIEDRREMARLAGEAVNQAIAQEVMSVADALKPVVNPQ